MVIHQCFVERESFEWNPENEWTPRWVTWLLRTVLADYRERRFGRDFETKLRERGYTLSDVVATIRNPESYIMRVRDEDGDNRVGFWNPETLVLVLWVLNRKRHRGIFLSCFEREDAPTYLRNRSVEFREIRSPRGGDQDGSKRE